MVIKKKIIQKYRLKINNIDKKLFLLLQKRLKIVKQIGLLKQQFNLSALDVKQKKKVLAFYERQTILLGLNKSFGKRLFSLIHSECLKVQK